MIFTTISRGAYMLKVIKIILQLISKQVDIWKVQEKQGSARAIKRVVQWVKLPITRVGSLTGGKGSFCDSASIFFSQFWWIITKIVIVITDISGNVTGAFYFASILFQSFWLKNIYFCCLQVPFQALRVVNPFFFFFFFFFDSFQTLKDHSVIWMSIWFLLAFYSEEGSKLLYVELLKHEVICSWRLVHIYLSDWWFWYEQWQIVLYLLSLKKIFKNKK